MFFSFRILFLVTPIYIGEITRETVRGRILSVQSVWRSVGFTVSFFLYTANIMRIDLLTDHTY